MIAGVDEAGRGCWAGPVVAGACILPESYPQNLLDDSKKLSQKKREEAFEWITMYTSYGVGIISSQDIDKWGLKKAVHQAMKQALSHLKQKPKKLLIDGNDRFLFDIPSEDIIKGDEKFACIAAASIVAKVTRDRMMEEYGEKYPHYGFKNHKGYGTKQHQHALEQYGIREELHRTSYKPIQKILTMQSLFEN